MMTPAAPTIDPENGLRVWKDGQVVLHVPVGDRLDSLILRLLEAQVEGRRNP